MKSVHLALGSWMRRCPERLLSSLGCRPDLPIPGKYVLWRSDAVNLSIQKVGHEEGGTLRWHESGDVFRSGDATL